MIQENPIEVKGKHFSVEFGLDKGMILIGDAAHLLWQPSAKEFVEQGNWLSLQDHMVEQIGNGVSVLAIGWPKNTVTSAQKQAFFEFIQVGANDYPMLLDFEHSDDLEEALRVVQGHPLVKLPAPDSPLIHEFLGTTEKCKGKWLCPMRFEAFIPWEYSQKIRLMQLWQNLAEQYGKTKQDFMVYWPIPTSKWKVQLLRETLAQIDVFKKEYPVPVVVRPSGSYSKVSKGWLQSVLIVWAMERGADALVVNPLQREVANISDESATSMDRALQKLPLEMKRWTK